MYRMILIVLAGFPILIHAGCQAGHSRSGPTQIHRPISSIPGQPAATETVESPENPLSSGAITLRDALAYALMHSPDLKAFSFEVRAAEARAVQAGLLPNPELEVEIEEFGGSGPRSRFDSAETTIQLGQLIELGGKRAKRVRLASLEGERVRWDYEAVRLDVMKEVAQAYIAVLAAQERVALDGKLLDVSRRAQSAVAQRVATGKDPPVEKLRADVALSKSGIDAKKATKALATARRKLAAVLGLEMIDFQEATGDFFTALPVPSYDDVEGAIAESPDLERWVAEERTRRAAVDLEKAKATSDVTVGGGVQYFGEGDDAAMVVGVALPIPLFNRNQGRVEEAMEKLAQAREQYKATKIERVTALAEALNRLTGAYDEVTVLQHDVLANAQQAFETAYQGYEEGKFDYLYVLDTQRTLFEARGQYIDALEAYHVAQADVERLIGRPLRPIDRAPSPVAVENHLSKEIAHER
jgi:cobalt-zinc-cadmium efflux system outer membrane protein